MPNAMHQHLPEEPHWQPPSHFAPPAVIQDWLLDKGSLTQRLKQVGHFSVLLQRELCTFASQQDYHLLGLAPEKAHIRDVYLALDDTPVVMARSVLPVSALQGENQRLSNMQERSLGSELFEPPRAIREALWLTQLPLENPLGNLWGRQSRFNKRGAKLLVAEFFLPALWQRLGVD